jgi:hypothetical protein
MLYDSNRNSYETVTYLVKWSASAAENSPTDEEVQKLTR